MKVRIQLKGCRTKALYIKPGMKIAGVLKKLNIKPDMVIAVRNGTIVPVDETLSDGDCLKLLEVASGG
jgi:sulfur carrier protein ThiS